MEQQEKRPGIFVPLSEEQRREIKATAASTGRQLQDFSAECLLTGFAAVSKGKGATSDSEPRRSRRRAS